MHYRFSKKCQALHENDQDVVLQNSYFPLEDEDLAKARDLYINIKCENVVERELTKVQYRKNGKYFHMLVYS